MRNVKVRRFLRRCKEKIAEWYNSAKTVIYIVLGVIGVLIVFSPSTLGIPPHWRRLLVFVGFIDAILLLRCLTRIGEKSIGAKIVLILILSAIAYLPLWPIDKLLDMKRERVEKRQRIEAFMEGTQKMPEDMKDFEKDYYSGSRCPWRFETKDIEMTEDGGNLVMGNNRFVISLANAGRANRLYSLHPKASIAELSSFATYLYDAAIAPRIRNHSSMPREATAIIEFCYQIQIAYIESLSDLVCDAFFKGERDELRERLGGQFPYRCHPAFRWDSKTRELLNMLSFKLQGREIGKAAIRYGGMFTECDPKYLVARMDDIKHNVAVDIRNNSYKDSKFPIEKCEEFAALWRELHIVAYYEAAQQVMRMNKEISDALTYVSDTSGYDNVHRVVELWRPLASKALKRHCYLFCDLPVVVGAHVAFGEVASAEGFFKNDRSRASKSAFQFSRMLYEGKVTGRLQSNYAANQLVQYHGALKKVLGKEQYKSLMTSLKLPAPEVLKVQEVK